MVWGEELLFDATKVRANASADSVVPRLREVVDGHLMDLFGPAAAGGPAAADAPGAPDAAREGATEPSRPAADTLTPRHRPAGAEAEPERTGPARARWDLLETCRLDPQRPAVGSYQRLSDQRISTTDPDAVLMASRGQRATVGYHDHYVVDGGKHRIILHALVTPADVMENEPMVDLRRRVMFRWRVRPDRAIGATTYGTAANIQALEDLGILAYVPLGDFDYRTPYFGRDRFTYDEARANTAAPPGTRCAAARPSTPARRWSTGRSGRPATPAR